MENKIILMGIWFSCFTQSDNMLKVHCHHTHYLTFIKMIQNKQNIITKNSILKVLKNQQRQENQ